MSKKVKQKKQKEPKVSPKPFRMYDYSLRFAFIFALYLTVLASLKYQAEVQYTEVFAIIAVILSAKFTSIKFFTQQKRLFTKEEKFRLIWSSWAMTWFVSIIISVVATGLFAGKEALVALVQIFSAMPTLNFIGGIFLVSIVVFGLLFLSFGLLASKEFDSLKRQEKI